MLILICIGVYLIALLMIVSLFQLNKVSRNEEVFCCLFDCEYNQNGECLRCPYTKSFNKNFDENFN
jgi:hypothetical protein